MREEELSYSTHIEILFPESFKISMPYRGVTKDFHVNCERTTPLIIPNKSEIRRNYLKYYLKFLKIYAKGIRK